MYHIELGEKAVIEVKECKDWSDVNNQLYYDSWNNELERYRSPFVFRALSNSAYKLDTTLMRLGGQYERLETHLIHSFIKYAQEHIKASDSIWDWLVLARHHGLPTRLLDWTYSPYVALHFATEDLHSQHPPIEGVIWCVDYKKTHKLLPRWLKKILQPDVYNMFTVDMLGRVATDLQQFDEKSLKPQSPEEPSEFVVFFEPPSLDDRVVNQVALHSMMSHPKALLDDWLEKHPELCRKLIIPAEIKWEIRDKLDQANINERMLYPGLDGLCRWLRRHYSPKTPQKKDEREQQS
jgi:FRG domain